MVRALGFEPRTDGLKVRCSTTELRPHDMPHHRILPSDGPPCGSALGSARIVLHNRYKSRRRGRPVTAKSVRAALILVVAAAVVAAAPTPGRAGAVPRGTTTLKVVPGRPCSPRWRRAVKSSLTARALSTLGNRRTSTERCLERYGPRTLLFCRATGRPIQRKTACSTWNRART